MACFRWKVKASNIRKFSWKNISYHTAYVSHFDIIMEFTKKGNSNWSSFVLLPCILLQQKSQSLGFLEFWKWEPVLAGHLILLITPSLGFLEMLRNQRTSGYFKALTKLVVFRKEPAKTHRFYRRLFDQVFDTFWHPWSYITAPSLILLRTTEQEPEWSRVWYHF